MKKLKNIKLIALSLMAIFTMNSCSDLEIEATDSVIKGALIFEGVANPAEALSGSIWPNMGNARRPSKLFCS